MSDWKHPSKDIWIREEPLKGYRLRVERIEEAGRATAYVADVQWLCGDGVFRSSDYITTTTAMQAAMNEAEEWAAEYERQE